MSDTIVDSSVVTKWILPEADSAQAQRLISEVALKGERLIVLDLAFVEVTNAIWKRFLAVWPHWTKRGIFWTSFRAARYMSNWPIAYSSQRPKSRRSTIAPFTTLCLSPSSKTLICQASPQTSRCIT